MIVSLPLLQPNLVSPTHVSTRESVCRQLVWEVIGSPSVNAKGNGSESFVMVM